MSEVARAMRRSIGEGAEDMGDVRGEAIVASVGMGYDSCENVLIAEREEGLEGRKGCLR